METMTTEIAIGYEAALTRCAADVFGGAAGVVLDRDRITGVEPTSALFVDPHFAGPPV